MNQHIFVPAGLENATSALVKALREVPEGGCVTLEKGVYHFYREGAWEQYLAPTNNHNGVKAIALPFFGRKNVTLEGNGAELLFHDRLFPGVVSGCQGITLRNFSVDFAFPRYAVGTVWAGGEDGFGLEFDEDQGDFSLENGCLAFRTGSQWRTTAQVKFFLWDPSGKNGVCFFVAGETRDPLTNLPVGVIRCDAESAGNRRVFFRYRPGSLKKQYAPGDVILVSHDENRENDVFFLEDSSQVRLENIEIFRGAGMGVIGQMCRDVSLEKGRIGVRPGRREPRSITADAYHFVHCDGLLSMKSCTARNTLDDAVNIHGIYTRLEWTEGRRARAQIGHHEQYGFLPYRPGDALRLIRPDGEEREGRWVVESAQLASDGTGIELTFANDCPGENGDYLENPDRMPEITIEGCAFEACPRVLISSSKPTRIRNNFFRLEAGLSIIDGMQYWYEAGPVEDVTLADNVFDNDLCAPGRAAVTIYVDGESGRIRRHRNIRLRGNQFLHCAKIVEASQVEHLTIEP